MHTVHWSVDVTTEPAQEPVSLDELKDHMRVDVADDDALIDALILAARLRAETFLQRALITQTITLSLDWFPAVILAPRPSLQSVTRIDYIDTAGATQTLAAAKYTVDAKSEPGRIMPAFGEIWPTTRDTFNAATVVYIAGYGLLPADVKEPIRQGIMHLAAHFYENREAVADMRKPQIMPLVGEALLSPYRNYLP